MTPPRTHQARTSASNVAEKLCLGAHLSAAGGVSKAIDGAIALELESLQLFTKNNNRWQSKPIDPKEIERFHQRHEQWGAHRQIFSHGSYLVNLASPDDTLWKKSLAAFIDEYERADALRLTGLVMHPGAHVGSGEEAGLTRVAEGIRQTLDHAPNGNTWILLENTAGQGSTLGRSFEELAQLMEAIDAPERVGVCLDSCHLLASGYDLRSPSSYHEVMRQLQETIGYEFVSCWHLNDSKGTLGSNLDRHENIGEGEVGDSGFRNILRDENFFGVPKILETPKKGGDDGDTEMDPVNLARLVELA